MSKYKHLDKFLAKHDKSPKPKKEKTKKSKITSKEREDLIDQMLMDFGYIEEG